MRAVAAVRAGRVDKKKVARIAHLTERGGFLAIAEVIGQLRSDAEGLPAWSAAAERLRRAAAILAVEINAFGRTGDVAAWRLGVDLVREPWGAWRLAWDQGKTSDGQDVGELWSEVGDIIDEPLLGGRPRRLAGLRYTELAGRNWLTHSEQAFASRHPSELVKEAIGVPLHDLRTMIADLLRRVDPAKARDLIASMLGHRSEAAGEEYRAACEGDWASREWRRDRGAIGRGGLPL
jgi:hypothetical protein